ncbi:MAG: NAD(P)H-dependent oxidoreductase subunit E [bacterium]|nr:NAD(P)H-dependent oxidoreductase subunit E [bacterium]
MSPKTICLDKVDSIIDSVGNKQSNLIAILQHVQAEYNYLPSDALVRIGVKMGISPATVYGVATFYSQFSLEPKGKYQIKCCDGTACHVRGSNPVLNAIRVKLGLEDGKYSTKDGLFSIETVSCLGACGLAPVVVINDKVYPQMTPDKIKKTIDDIRNEEEGE